MGGSGIRQYHYRRQADIVDDCFASTNRKTPILPVDPLAARSWLIDAPVASSECAEHSMFFSLLAGSALAFFTAAAPTVAQIDALYPALDALYQDLHTSPELSGHETKTAAKMAQQLRALGISVTTGIGGFGVVGVLKNGPGPTVMLRTDLDGLPIEEKTGLPFASVVRATDASGADVGVMHACGHDLHMTAWIGAATWLARNKSSWSGTLMLVGQPAEEMVTGARAMLADGLFSRFSRPDFALALHDTPKLPAGQMGYTSGYALANVDAVAITIFGKGGHGAAPASAIDPIVIAARTVLALQTIISRENNPLDPAVITIGSIHGGTKSNIIPDEVKLQLSVRSYKEPVRQRLLAAIGRITRAEAIAGAAAQPPVIVVTKGTQAVYNDPKVTARVVLSLRQILGPANVIEQPPEMVSEDFSEYGLAGVPAALLWLGAAPAVQFAQSETSGVALPSLHSAQFAPDRMPAIKTAVRGLATAALELFAKP